MKHVCPSCGSDFNGRRNKKFCSIKCKSEVNNAMARVRNEKFQDVLHRIRKNHKVLFKLYKRYGGQTFRAGALEGLGFSFNGITGIDSKFNILVMDYKLCIDNNQNYKIEKCES